MNILLVYDSFFGNTEKIAKEIEKVLKQKNKVKLVKVSNTNINDLDNIDMIIVGSPTRAFTYSPNIKIFLKSIPKGKLENIKIAAFDTRVDLHDVGSPFLTFMVNIFGYAKEKIEKELVKKGGIVVVKSEGFFVKESEGPLKKGEIERVSKWLNQLTN